MKTVKILVMDAQGGGLGKQIVSLVKKNYPEVYIMAVGTNTMATSAMLKAGADEAATGENAVRVASRHADVIMGPVGIVIADAMLGEITPGMACAVAQADAKRILVPFNNCDNYIVGINENGIGKMVDEAVEHLKTILDNE